jgi:CheY-like chemotaxis protein
MSEAMTVPPLTDATTKRTPTVYFIDDSATMREVVKIAFRRENIHVVTCADAASALAQFEQTPPDAVITDVIMPDQDGYSVCTQVKQHPQFGHIPVVLMSGVVNKTVADKAVSVHADELIRKPFQPQELIGRVKALLNPKPAPTASPDRTALPSPPGTPSVLTNFFAPPPAAAPQPPPSQAQGDSAWPRALADAFTPRPVPGLPGQHQQSVPSNLQTSQPGQNAPSQSHPAPVTADLQKLRVEVARLEMLVKKLQTQLEVERQYNQALEAQIHSFTHSE